MYLQMMIYQKKRMRGPMIIKLFGKQITINNKKWQQDLLAWSLLYRTEIVIAIASFILGAIIF